jgi:phage terminase large subunit-like protein
MENGEVGYWLQEVCGFPARTRDDRVDTMTMALIQMEKINISPVWSMSLGGGKAH